MNNPVFFPSPPQAARVVLTPRVIIRSGCEWAWRLRPLPLCGGSAPDSATAVLPPPPPRAFDQ